MNQSSPVLPVYETTVLEPLFNFDPSLDPKVLAALQQILEARLNTVYYQYLNLILKIVQPLAQFPLTGDAKPGAVPNEAAITLDGPRGIITTEALATAAGGVYTLEFTNPSLEPTSLLMLTISNGTNTGGMAVLQSILVDDQVAMIKIQNSGATAFNGTLVIQFLIQ
jgi:hypothetical protein